MMYSDVTIQIILFNVQEYFPIWLMIECQGLFVFITYIVALERLCTPGYTTVALTCSVPAAHTCLTSLKRGARVQ